MSAHKCNKCLHQAYIKTKSNGDHEFCLALNIAIEDTFKNCTEFVDVGSKKEPVCFLEDLDKLIKNPSATELRKIKKIKKKVEELRAWGKQANKPRMIKQKK